MKKRFLFFAVCFCLFIAGPVPAQDKTKKAPKPNPQVKIELKQLISLAKKSGKQDPAAVEVIRKLVNLTVEGNPRDKIKTAMTFGKILLGARRKPGDTVLFQALADGLSRLGAAGAKYLFKAADGKVFDDKKLIVFRCNLIRCLGRTREDSMAKPLLDLMDRDPEPKINAAAVEALGEYEKSSLKVRKKIVEKVVKFFSNVNNKANQTTGNDLARETFRRKRNLIAGPCNNTLKRLTPESFTKPLAWHKWYQNNKHKRWGADQKKKDGGKNGKR